MPKDVEYPIGMKVDITPISDALRELNEAIQAEVSYKKTCKDYLSDIPFYTSYYLAYPFIWLAYWLWQGIMQAKVEVWD